MPYRFLGQLRWGGRHDVGLPCAPWPCDPLMSSLEIRHPGVLDRVGRLSGPVGIVRLSVDPRAAFALKAVIYARQGKHRKSIPELRKAFPALGGPFQAALPLAARKLYYPLAYEDGIRSASQVAGLPSHLVFGIIRRESAFDLTARSSAGASGLMQLMPATAREVARKLGLTYSRDRLTSDPVFNVRLGTTYFRQVLDMFNGQEELALAGYNGGPYRIKRLWKEASGEGLDTFVEDLGIPESKSYVKWILVLSDSYRNLYS